MAAPTTSDLGALLGRTVTPTQGTQVLMIVSAMVSSYTRGQGFTAGVPNDALRAVILTSSARFLAHPRQIQMNEQLGPNSAGFREGWTGWTTTELAVLNAHRVRAA